MPLGMTSRVPESSPVIPPSWMHTVSPQCHSVSVIFPPHVGFKRGRGGAWQWGGMGSSETGKEGQQGRIGKGATNKRGCVRVRLCPPERNVEVLATSPWEHDLTWEQGVCRCHTLSELLQWPRSTTTGVLMKREGHRETQRWPRDLAGRDGRGVARSPGVPGASGSWRRQERTLLSRLWEGSPGFQTRASGAGRGSGFCVVRPRLPHRLPSCDRVAFGNGTAHSAAPENRFHVTTNPEMTLTIAGRYRGSYSYSANYGPKKRTFARGPQQGWPVPAEPAGPGRQTKWKAWSSSPKCAMDRYSGDNRGRRPSRCERQ